MKTNFKYIMPILALGLSFNVTDVNAARETAKDSKGEIIFKIHDVVPEKNEEGEVIYCNLGATFFNRTQNDVSNLSISLVWTDDVIGEIIDIEDRLEREAKKNELKDSRPRYSTSSFTSRNVSTDLKLPPIKVNQQITLRTKVDTDRCFLLLNEMDVVVSNCGTLGSSSSKEACANYFQFISPKQGEYYTEFEEISWEHKLLQEDEKASKLQKDLDTLYNETINALMKITSPVSEAEKKMEENKDGVNGADK